jgi:hypothetical protein
MHSIVVDKSEKRMGKKAHGYIKKNPLHFSRSVNVRKSAPR